MQWRRTRTCTCCCDMNTRSTMLGAQVCTMHTWEWLQCMLQGCRRAVRGGARCYADYKRSRMCMRCRPDCGSYKPWVAVGSRGVWMFAIW